MKMLVFIALCVACFQFGLWRSSYRSAQGHLRAAGQQQGRAVRVELQIHCCASAQRQSTFTLTHRAHAYTHLDTHTNTHAHTYEQDSFSLNPTAGVVAPGQRQLIAISYEPREERTSVVIFHGSRKN